MEPIEIEVLGVDICHYTVSEEAKAEAMLVMSVGNFHVNGFSSVILFSV